MSLETGALALSSAAGLLSGFAYFSSLWFAVQRMAQARRPVLWILSTALLRLAAVTGVFFLVMNGRWERLMVCLAGFLIARTVVIRLAGTERGRRAAS